MAEKCFGTLQPEIGRELCLVKRKNGEYRGYKKDILVENLSERESTIFVCIRCQGILREVCISSGGEQFCSCCKNEGEQTHPNLQTDNMILSFKCSCPLMGRGCEWLGNLGNCQNHLDTCVYVHETCELRCGEVLQRDELRIHEKENCPQRIVRCEHCNKEFKSCELPTHLDKCPKMKVPCGLKCGKVMCRELIPSHVEIYCGLVVDICKLGCGVKLTRNELKTHVRDTCIQRVVMCEHCLKYCKVCDLANHLDECPKMEVSCELCGEVMCREDMTQHLEKYCVEKEIECPFAKYKCEVIVKRKDLNQHLEEKRTEHLELKLNAMEELIMKQNETTKELIMKQNKTTEELNSIITKQNEKIEKLNIVQQSDIAKIFNDFERLGIRSLEQTLKQHPNFGKLQFTIMEIPQKYCNPIQERFEVAGYYLEIQLICSSVFWNTLVMKFFPQNGWFYDGLKWPFRAEFITFLVCHNKPENTKVFKSEMIEVQRADFNSGHANGFTIATISKDEVSDSFIQGRGTDFRIFVIF